MANRAAHSPHLKQLFSCLHIPRACWLLATLCLLGPAATAQQAFVRHFGPAEGLRPTFVYAILQDRQGYLWLGTGEGLVRYDGHGFVTFNRKDGLAEDVVVSLREDRANGRLWVGHYQGGISVKTEPSIAFTATGRSAETATLPANGPPPVDTASIGRYLRHYRLRLPRGVVPICLFEDREGNAWLGTAGQGLWRHSDRYLRRYPTPTDGTPPIALSPGAQGTVVVGTAAGLQTATATGRLEALGLSTPGVPVRAILPLPSGGYWAGTAGDGVWQYRPAQPRRRVATLPGTLEVSALAYAAGSGLWVGTAADGLYLVPTDTAQPVRHFTAAEGLPDNAVSALLADRAGRVWVGTHGPQLAAFDFNTQRFTLHRLGSRGASVSSLAEDAAGRVWVGTEGQGLFCFNGRRWRQFSAPNRLSTNFVYGLLALPARTKAADPGRWLLLSHLQGLTLFDASTGRYTPLAAPGDTLVRDCRGPLALASGARPAVWAATRGGLVRLDVREALGQAREKLPGLVLTAVEVDGRLKSVKALGDLAPTRHRINFSFAGLSLAANAEPLEYQYRLRGLAEAWSRPSPSPEAQFPGLDAGRYTLEVRVRHGSTGPWSPVATAGFSIDTPFWRTWWFAALVLAGLGSLGFGVVRGRERVLRQRQLVLERTVAERTADLLVARDAAEASRQAKARFLANMSHEIRTPMNAVIGLTHLLQATGPTAEQREYLTAIESSSHNLLVIINDILDSSKMDAGRLALEQAPFRLPEAVRRLGALFKFATEMKGLFLRIEVDPDVPTAVVGDPVRLNQMLVNLVGNAIKFTRQGGVTVAVSVVPGPASAAQALVHFSVRDTGIGIPADKLEAIFEDFAQANASTTREYGGTGLGLSIARNLAQLHGGQLKVNSAVNRGSEFYFDIAYEIADPGAAQPEAPAGRLTPFEPPLRVLVAEDNALNQLVARKTLEAWNVQVTIAENGRAAVQAAIAAAPPFDAVLMDVQMPEMDGYEATRQLRLHFPGLQALPIIGLTASVLPEDRALALAAGMNDTLAKPFEPAMLYARLAYFTGRGTASGAEEVAAPMPPEAAPAPAARPLAPNWGVLEALAGGNENFLRQIVRTFLTEASALEAVLNAACPADRPGLASAAHKLKGQVAYFAVPVLHAQLDELEQAARNPDSTTCEALVNGICQHLAALYPQLEARTRG